MRKPALKKYFRHYYYKVVMDRGTPEYIARGWALGAAVGSIIPLGGQLLVSIPLSFLLKGSKIGATLGTFHTNPLTIWFIYPAQCWIGNKLIGGNLTYQAVEAALDDLIRHKSYPALLKLSGEVIASFFTGGILLALILTPIVYYVVKFLVIQYRKQKELRKLRRNRNSI